ncbi:Na+/H+ antiporter subunit E [Hyphococcus sp.]|jgi:multicomponent Na+:H+ antiporter subunit E|uniref:Na+/H+ antiporter subunit E n=1 Tax=Hyphococcus sp. TaxID=2038636 RepID=UPI003D12C6FA
MGRFIILVLALAALWLLLSGYFDKALLLGFGVVSVLFSAWLAKRAGVLDDDSVPMSLMPRILGYWLWLGGEIGKANLIVMRQALSVEPKLSPKFFTVPCPPKSSVGKATFANSITLTPGTVAVDLRENEILVHGLTEELCDVAAITDMGERVAKAERIKAGGAS